MNLVEFQFLQVEAPHSCQDAILFNIVKKKCDLVFGPSVTGFLKVFRCGGGNGIMGSR